MNEKKAEFYKGARKELLAILKLYDDAATKFINKVDTGRARSVETYKELKAARLASKRFQNETLGV